MVSPIILNLLSKNGGNDVKTKIFYFSATGNSLNYAKKIATELSDAELVSIPKVLKDPIDESAPRIGLIFPVYAWGMPRIVDDFLKKLQLHKGQYIFAVAVSAGTPGETLKKLKKILRSKGSDLNAGFAIKEASYALLSKSNVLIKFIRNIAGDVPKSGGERLSYIIEIVRNNQNLKPESSAWGANFLGNLLHGVAVQSFKAADSDYWVNDKCNNCQNCERICPRSNIEMKNGKPIWNHNCELCFACIQWCPQEAIQYQNETEGITRSHNSEVTINDFILR